MLGRWIFGLVRVDVSLLEFLFQDLVEVFSELFRVDVSFLGFLFQDTFRDF